MVSICFSPSVAIVAIAAYSAQMEHGAEASMSMFIPANVLLFLVLNAAATLDLLDFLLAINDLAFSTSSLSWLVRSVDFMGRFSVRAGLRI